MHRAAPVPDAARGVMAAMLHVRVTGDGSTLPAASRARTANACSPSESSASSCGDTPAASAGERLAFERALEARVGSRVG